jgi:hypothetical protein
VHHLPISCTPTNLDATQCGSHGESLCFCLFACLKTFSSVYDSYIGVFVKTFPNVQILYPSLVHPFHYSPSSHTPLLKMTLTGFNVPYSYMYRKHFNHIYPLLPSPFAFLLSLFLSPSHDLLYIPILYCLSVCSSHSVGFALVFYL